MKFSAKLLPALAGLALIGSVGLRPAQAVPVTYSTSGTFTAGPGAVVSGPTGNVVTFMTPAGQTLTLTYNAAPTTTVNAPPPTIGNLGFFVLNMTGPSSPNLFTVPTGTTFALTVNQTQPSVASSAFMSSLRGTVGLGATGPSGQLELVISNPNMTLPGGPSSANLPVVYRLANLSEPPITAQPNTRVLGFGGTLGTSVEAQINVIPEPSSIVMAGAGLAGLVGLGLRRRRRAA